MLAGLVLVAPASLVHVAPASLVYVPASACCPCQSQPASVFCPTIMSQVPLAVLNERGEQLNSGLLKTQSISISLSKLLGLIYLQYTLL